MGFPRAIIEPGQESARYHIHVEAGRGRGALSSLLVVPREADALARVLRDLHDPAGPADLDSRLGRMAAAAPPGTAFLIALDDLVWVFPANGVRCARDRDGTVLRLEEPQVLRMKPGDRFDATAEDGTLLGQLRAEPAASFTAQDAPMSSFPQHDDEPRRARFPWRRAFAGVGAVAAAAAIAMIYFGLQQKPKTARTDAHVGPSLESRLVSFLAGPRNAGPENADRDSSAAMPAASLPVVVAQPETVPVAAEPEDSARATESSRAAPWEFRAGGAITSSPLLHDGRVIFGSRDGKLYCLDASSGEVVWTRPSGAGIGSSPCASGDLCYVGNYAGEVLAVRLDSGELAWKARTAGRIVSSPCVVDDVVLIGSYDRSIHAFDAKTGKRQWAAPTGGAVRASPEPLGDDAIVIGSSEGSVYCIAVRDGKTRWKRKAPAAIHAAAAWDEESGRVFVGARDGTVLCLDEKTGKTIWSVKAGADVNARPGLLEDLVLVGTGRGRLLALDVKDGARKWEARASRGFDSTPLVVSSHVVAASSDGTVHVLDAETGDVQSKHPLSSEIFTSPAGGDGLVYVGTLRGTLYALGLP